MAVETVESGIEETRGGGGGGWDVGFREVSNPKDDYFLSNVRLTAVRHLWNPLSFRSHLFILFNFAVFFFIINGGSGMEFSLIEFEYYSRFFSTSSK